MSLEHILHALEVHAEAEVAEIESQARVQAEEVRCHAQTEAAETRQKTLDAVVPQIDAGRAQRINTARLQAQHARLEAREALVSAAFEAATDRVAGLRRQPQYTTIVWALLNEAFQEMGDDVRLLVDARDVKLVRGLLAEHGIVAEVLPALNSWGGVVAECRDGDISLDNTLTTRLERVRELYRGRVAALLDVGPAVP